MPKNWDAIAEKAAQKTNEQLSGEISSLTSLNDEEINKIIFDTGISKQDLTDVLKTLKDASISNDKKATAIKNIAKGVDIVIGIAAKFI